MAHGAHGRMTNYSSFLPPAGLKLGRRSRGTALLTGKTRRNRRARDN
eukprot:CAMPEP_0176284288 /NCGR_PEP_ID=MMETSP0121_2-20121125/51769_1 /TAXON_ID=160619 /ORGANISM="Kryptoperidinium foliaceum, Strain CCMP 1326" /LENGTH=46 /DNA_ID= /DNA_START= /DNA_END= /DNA_ORIENTATION=